MIFFGCNVFFLFKEYSHMQYDLPDLGPGEHDERATGGPPVDTHSGDRRTASSITFKDMISTKSIFFDFERYFYY